MSQRSTLICLFSGTWHQVGGGSMRKTKICLKKSLFANNIKPYLPNNFSVSQEFLTQPSFINAIVLIWQGDSLFLIEMLRIDIDNWGMRGGHYLRHPKEKYLVVSGSLIGLVAWITARGEGKLICCKIEKCEIHSLFQIFMTHDVSHNPSRHKDILDLSHNLFSFPSSVLSPILYKHWFATYRSEFEQIQKKKLKISTEQTYLKFPFFIFEIHLA